MPPAPQLYVKHVKNGQLTSSTDATYRTRACPNALQSLASWCAAADEEEAWIDLDTVQGYKRTVMCEAVRDEVARNLGETPGACTELLNGMTQRRLMPTPWLNQVCKLRVSLLCILPYELVMHHGCRRDHSLPMPCGQYAPILSRKHGAPLCVQNFREPLYLRDKPVRVEDTRSEEERKYPELFRQKLQGAPRPIYVHIHVQMSKFIRSNHLHSSCRGRLVCARVTVHGARSGV